MQKINVAIIGATGFVGQRFITLLADHPWFEIKYLFASARSAGQVYQKSVADRWKMESAIPVKIADMEVLDLESIEQVSSEIKLVFCAVDMPKQKLIALEEKMAKLGLGVISNNSANRLTSDVPMIIPEINPEHTAIIKAQRERLGTKTGFIACKPNCSIQSYVPALHALRQFKPKRVFVSTYQAISGAGKTFATWPEMVENLIPFIGGEEEKSQQEPLKIWGSIADDKIDLASDPIISAQCYRVAVQEGHTAAVSVEFAEKPSREQILAAWKNFKGATYEMDLPSAPKTMLAYCDEDNRPQVKLDVMRENGMGISIGRLRKDPIFDYKFTCLSHNTLRGAAGGAVLMAELLVKQGFVV